MDVIVRHAACVILLRRDSGSTEVYLARRAATVPFLGGFHVFPGGTSEPDETPTTTALRELFEETGVLACHGNASPEVRSAARQTLIGGHAPAWTDLLHAQQLTPMQDALVPLGLWVTPPYAPTIYRANYYALWLPDGEQPEIWPGELVDGAFYEVRDAIASHQRGELFLSYPVLETLRVMIEHDLDIDRTAATLEARGGTYPHAGGEILRGVHICPVRTFTLPPATHTNCYILGDKELYVVDPASPIPEEQERLLAYLRHLERGGCVVREIWLTHHHKDHTGGAEALRTALQVPVAAHPATALALALAGQIRVDRHISDGEMVEMPCAAGPPARWRALHTPGHAPGHLCFYDETLGTLISGDNVLGLGTVLIAPPDGNMATYLTSLRRMQNRRLGFLLPAHGPPVATAHDRIEMYIQHRLRREGAIAAALRDAALTAAEIVPKVYTDVDPNVFPLAEINVRAHLEKLVAEQRVGENAGRYFALSEGSF